jgi:hypothetical protein
MAKVMITLQLEPREADLPHVRTKLGLRQDEIDDQFGVVKISPKENLYCVLIEEDAAARVTRYEGVEGPFSNPKIETFGPPQATEPE